MKRRDILEGMKIIDATKEICYHQVCKEIGIPVDFAIEGNGKNDKLIEKLNVLVSELKRIKNEIKFVKEINNIAVREDSKFIDKIETDYKRIFDLTVKTLTELGWIKPE
jgi:hypothetical protein